MNAKKYSLAVRRFFTKNKKHPFDEIAWEKRDVMVAKMNGAPYKAVGVEFPAFWSQNASHITASKYFRGRIGTKSRETSVRQMITRVAGTIRGWGENHEYFTGTDEARIFEEELTHLLVNQKASFNSPVWFNVGIKEKPQCSACQPYRALVSTPSGFYPIGEIVEKNLIGLSVYDSNGITRVTAVKDNGIKNVHRIVLRNGAFIEATGDHVVKAAYERRTDTQWVRVDALQKGMRLHLYPHRAAEERENERYTIFIHEQNIHSLHQMAVSSAIAVSTPTITLTKAHEKAVSEAALAGWLQADGFVGQYITGTNRSLMIEFIVVTEEEKRWVEQNLNMVFPSAHRHIRITKTKNGTPITRIRLYGEIVRSFVEKYELLARRETIRFPRALWRSNPAILRAYLKSVFQSEGFVRINNNSVHLALDTISKDWMHDLQIALFGLGIYSRVRFKYEKRNNRAHLYELDISSGGERKKFAEQIGFLSKEKNKKLEASLVLASSKNIPDLREEEIIFVEDLGNERVYDIQTESGEYLSNNIAVHNCFILDIEDDMHSILDWIKTEGMIFKGGSGSGINLSPLRSKEEELSVGGYASGPVSFMRGADSVAGMIASGGATRRAAKMVVLNIDHPDVMDFIRCKAEEEKKIRALMAAGYDMRDLNNKAWCSIQYQNANNSVRVSDDFMKVAEQGGEWSTHYVVGGPAPLRRGEAGKAAHTYKARELLGEIAQAAWECGDPGMQYDTTINDWHTCPRSGRINASNPCFTGDTRVATNKGLISFEELYARTSNGELFHIWTDNRTAENPLPTINATPAQAVMMTGINDIYRLRFSDGSEIRATKNHRFFTKNRGMVAVENLTPGDEMTFLEQPIEFGAASLAMQIDLEMLFASGWGRGRNWKPYKPIRIPSVWTTTFAEYAGYVVGDGCVRLADEKSRLSTVSAVFGSQEDRDELMPHFGRVFEECGIDDVYEVALPNGTTQVRISRTPFARLLAQLGVSTKKAQFKVVPHAIFQTPKSIIAAFLRGLFSADGCVYDGQKSRYVGLGSVSKELLFGVQQLLRAFGIQGRIYETGKPKSSFSYINKQGVKKHYISHQMYDLRISGFSITRFKDQIGFLLSKKQEKLEKLCNTHEFYDIDNHVRLIEMIRDGSEMTYNLTESTNHSYIANGCVVANCAEYMHVDNSACNLASINLLKFLKPNNTFDVPAFVKTVQIMILAQEIIVGNSSYPTERIEKNTHDLRQLGLGFANLGALLMALGLPYDSDEARALAGAITALMCGEAYRYSAEIARRVGPFNGFTLNREPMLRVIRKHQQHIATINKNALADKSRPTERPFGQAILNAAAVAWKEALRLGEKYGYRNSQVTVIAPTGTIAFMMDCDTTGIEPEFALVKMKQLVGGGYMKIVNQTVRRALTRLGYTPHEREKIAHWIEEKGTAEGAPVLKEKHVAVFDTAVKPAESTRAISWQGHVTMTAAVQPFISGAISKTFNMPADATVEEIADAYTFGWKSGLKAFAVYRDGSKATQPLASLDTSRSGIAASGEKGKEEKEHIQLVSQPSYPIRHHLPATRASHTHKFVISGHEGYLTYSAFEGGAPAEIFIRMAKQGSTLAGLLDAFAITVSTALQYGVPLRQLAQKFIYGRYEPAGVTENPDILFATSITDYIFRYLAFAFLGPDDLADLGIASPPVSTDGRAGPPAIEKKIIRHLEASLVAHKEEPVYTSAREEISAKIFSVESLCRLCGGMLVRTGSCRTCMQCGTSDGGC